MYIYIHQVPRKEAKCQRLKLFDDMLFVYLCDIDNRIHYIVHHYTLAAVVLHAGRVRLV